MAQEAIAFAAPRAEEMTRTVAALGGAGIAGVAEGVIIRMAPQMGAAAPILTWGTLLGAPVVGIAGALFTRGMLGDVFQGVAAGGTGILAYSLPALLLPAAEKKAPGQLTAEERAALAAVRERVKQLGPGAAQRAQAQIRAAVGAGYE